MIPRRRLTIRGRDVPQWLYSTLFSTLENDARDAAAFEATFRDYLGCSFARATCSGRDALQLALDALGVRPGDELIVPAYTLGELVTLLKSKGYVPVAADIEPDTFNMDLRSIEAHLTPRTRAIVALHLHGAPCDIEAICELARRHDIRVVEDCAHAMGAAVGERKVGTFGDASFFSLESNKALATYGGGVVVVKDRQAAERVTAALSGRRRSKWPALKKALSHWKEELAIRSPLYGPLARLAFSPRFAAAFERSYRRSQQRQRSSSVAYSGFQARVGLKALAELDDRNARLNRLWQRLADRLPEGLAAQVRDRIGQPAFYNFVARSHRIAPAELRRQLFRRGVDIGIGNEVMNDCAKLLGAEDCPVVAAVFKDAVILPLYDGLSRRRFDRLVRALHQVSAGGP